MPRCLHSRVFAALALALLLLNAGCGRAPPPAANQMRPATVGVVTISPSNASASVRLSGLVGFKRETPLAFDAPGTLSELAVDAGDRVRAGQILARVRRATVGTDSSEAALARQTAERQLERVQALFDRGFASQAALDDARLAVARARDVSPLVAPAAGIVLRRAAEPGQTIAAGQAVLILGEPAQGMVVRASASAADAARVTLGQRAVITTGDAGDRSGVVSRIGPKSDDATGAFEVEIRFDDAADLLSGEVASVSLPRAETAGADQTQLEVPLLALLDARADQGVVYVLDAQNRAHRRSVETGGVVDGAVIVLSGLSVGERIIVEGAAYVRDNEVVRPVAAALE